MSSYARVFKTGYFTFVISYLVFLLADYWRPGFVSWIFSAHWLVFLAIVFGILWAWSTKEAENSGSRLIKILFKISLSLALFIVLWSEGDVFADFRIILALAAAILPWLISKLLSEKSEAGKM